MLEYFYCTVLCPFQDGIADMEGGYYASLMLHVLFLLSLLLHLSFVLLVREG